MPQYIAWISLDNRELAAGELTFYLGAKASQPAPKVEYEKPENHIVFFEYEGDESRFARLAYTKRIMRVREYVALAGEQQRLSTTIVCKSYRVDFLNSMLDINQELAKRIYAIIFRSVQEPRIQMKEPEVVFCAYVELSTNTVWIGEQAWENMYAYERRKSHLREKRHPAAMPPKLIRAMINLAGIDKGSIYDPFCGAGGVPIEAMHCQLNVIGSDNDSRMVEGTQKNIRNEIIAHNEMQSLCDVEKDIFKLDATLIDRKTDAIVTDVPYGKNTKKLNHPNLYKKFLDRVAQLQLATRVVICFPHFAQAGAIIKQTQWECLASYSLPVNNSLAREVYVLQLNGYRKAESR